MDGLMTAGGREPVLYPLISPYWKHLAGHADFAESWSLAVTFRFGGTIAAIESLLWVSEALDQSRACVKTGFSHSPNSYRTDPAVPAFDDSGPVTVMDGECVLCGFGARLLARFDKAAEFRICRAQTELGRSLFLHYGLSPDDPESWLYLVDGRAYTSLDAVIRVGNRVGGFGLLLQPLRLLPRALQDWLYRLVATNRYRLFGRTDMCAIPDPGLRARLIE